MPVRCGSGGGGYVRGIARENRKPPSVLDGGFGTEASEPEAGYLLYWYHLAWATVVSVPPSSQIALRRIHST